MAPLTFQTGQKAQYLLLQLALPNRPKVAAGVFLLDPSSDRLYLRLRDDWEAVAGPEDVEVLAHLQNHFSRVSEETGGERFLKSLEDTLSNTLRITERESVAVGDFTKALNRLFERYVQGVTAEPVALMPYRTHLPLYSLRAAAGKFGEDMEVEPESWVRAPEHLRLTADMYVARVVGRSMEPLIPDGSLCIFRRTIEGSRQGKLVLVQRRTASETGGEFTIKRYTSRKTVTEDRWKHERIRLEPLNPEFEAWDLEPSELEQGPYHVCGEFLGVLPVEEL
jgi:SOS-response transcriptional repressor LexA